jgi:hypothetical protein
VSAAGEHFDLTKTKSPAEFPHRGFCLLVLTYRSAAARRSGCPTEFSKLGGIVYFVVQPPVAPHALNMRGTISALGGSLLPRGLLWYRAKLKDILGDFSNRPGFRSTLHGHIDFHDLTTHWSQ